MFLNQLVEDGFHCSHDGSFVLVIVFFLNAGKRDINISPDWSISSAHAFFKSAVHNPLLIGSNSSEDVISSLFYHLDQSNCPIPPVRVRDQHGLVPCLAPVSSEANTT